MKKRFERGPRISIAPPRGIIRGVAVLLCLAGLVLSQDALAQYTDADSNISFTISGCRNPSSTNLQEDLFLCLDEEYTNGNLGKTWNELDRVPHRVTMQAGDWKNDEPKVYTFAIVADYWEVDHPGYDIISEPILNEVLSDTSCSIEAVSAQDVKVPGIGGTDESIYRYVTMEQYRNTTCVIDYHQRLALGSHEYPGSSLHSNLANVALSTQGTGARDVSIPVKEIRPQELSKTMEAFKDVAYYWLVDKGPSPDELRFGDTCADGGNGQLPLRIRIDWEKKTADPNDQDYNYNTKITACNPAVRPIEVTATDVIYADGGEIYRETFPSVVVAPNTCTKVGEINGTAPGTTQVLSNEASAVYSDPAFPEDTIPGNTQAESDAMMVDGGVVNDTATIVDAETITGAGLSFSVDAVESDSGATGHFTLEGQEYTLGDEVPADKTLIWESDLQQDSGDITFVKTIYLKPYPGITSGSISDLAEVYSEGQLMNNAMLAVDISAEALGQLTISKTIPDVLQEGDDDVTFSFNVTGPEDFDETVTLTFAPGDTYQEFLIPQRLPLGEYFALEAAETGWQPKADDLGTELTLANECGSSIDFENSVMTPLIQVSKQTVPSGENLEGWCMLLYKVGEAEPVSRACTNAEGIAEFQYAAGEGSYRITEDLTDVAGWVQASADCTFEVNLPLADPDAPIGCSMTNEKLGSITVIKETIPASTGVGFGFKLLKPEGQETTSLMHSQSDTFEDLRPGTYSLSEDPLAEDGAWFFDRAECDHDQDPANIQLAGEHVTCTFYNKKKGNITVVKTTEPALTGHDFWFSTSWGDSFSLKDGDLPYDSGLLMPGDGYSVLEVPESMPDGWYLDTENTGCTDGTASYSPDSITLEAGETVACTFHNYKKRANVKIYKHTLPSGQGPFTFDFSGDGFQLSDGEFEEFSVWAEPDVPYTVSEDAPAAEWELLPPTCTGGHTIDNIDPAPGETVECHFTNRMFGRITVDKVTVPERSTQLFGFESSFGGFDLADESPFKDTGLIPSQSGHSVAEVDDLRPDTLPDWDLFNKICTNGTGPEDPAGFVLDPGEHVHCVFTNYQRGKVKVIKKFNGAVDTSKSVTFKLFEEEYGDGSNPIATANTSSADPVTGELNFGDGLFLKPAKTYVMCEDQVNVAWSYVWLLDGIVPDPPPYNPNANDDPPEDLGIRCVDFSVAPGAEAVFDVNNIPPPEGGPRTIGYWKNWNMCSGGNQAATAAANGGAEEGFFLLEDALPQTLGELEITKEDCDIGVAILDKSDIESGKKRASDAAYAMAAQLLAAKANLQVGAISCPQVVEAVAAADALLSQIAFDGTGSYLAPKDRRSIAERAEATALAGTLDTYNNGLLCVAP